MQAAIIKQLKEIDLEGRIPAETHEEQSAESGPEET
jgi:hypothetical protein